MKSIYAKFIINILGIISLLSCQYQEEIVEPATDMNNTTNYYDILEESLNTVFNETYNNITINTTFSEITNMFKESSKEFFASKGYFATDYDIVHTRGMFSSPFDNIDNLNDIQKTIINKVTSILQQSNYNDVRLAISQLYEQTCNNYTLDGKEEILRYIKYIENMLCFLEKENGKIDVLNVLIKYNEFHEIKLTTRSGTVSLPDGIYPHPVEKNKFIMVQNGHVFEFSCANGLIYCHSAGGCTFPDCDTNTGWWESWGKCAAAILGGAGIEGLGGAGIGSVVPGLGTVAGAIIGAISGAFSGAVVGC